MPWQIIKQSKADIWNEKLKSTDAEFCQYPYYISSEYTSIFSRPVFLNYVEDNSELAYAAIIEIGITPFKFGVVDCAPVLLRENVNLKSLLDGLLQFARQKNYLYLQVRPPNNSPFIQLLEGNNSFKKELLFPFHKKVEYDLNIYNKPEKELLAGFKMQCRRKIVLAGREPFEFKKIDDVKDLKEIRALFQKVVATKGYEFLPFHIYRDMYLKGHPHNLCDIYAVYLHGKMVNAVLVVKDRLSSYHYISGLVVDGFKASESPPAKLHFHVMKDAFYNDGKQFYNMSYGGSSTLVRFKELFNPVEIKKSDYYTYVINKKTLKLFSKFSLEKADFIRRMFKNFNNFLFRSFSAKK